MSAIEPGAAPAEGAAVEAPAAAPDFTDAPEFKNVREAQAYAREHDAVPNLRDIPEEHVDAPAAAVEIDEFGDVFPPAGEPTPSQAATAVPGGTDLYGEFGGRQSVEDAIVVAQALRTESGVRAVVAQGLTALGFDPANVAAFMQSPAGQAAIAEATPGAAAASPDPWSDIADDDVVDGATVKTMLTALGRQITEQVLAGQAAATEPLQRQIQEDRQRIATNTTDAALVEALNLPTDPALVTDVQKSQVQDALAFAARYVQEGNWDPAHIRSAVLRGASDMKARDEARFQAYVADKRAAKAAAPANIGGASPAGGEAVREPQSAKEAAQMRKALGL